MHQNALPWEQIVCVNMKDVEMSIVAFVSCLSATSHLAVFFMSTDLLAARVAHIVRGMMSLLSSVRMVEFCFDIDLFLLNSQLKKSAVNQLDSQKAEPLLPILRQLAQQNPKLKTKRTRRQRQAKPARKKPRHCGPMESFKIMTKSTWLQRHGGQWVNDVAM